MSTSYQPYIDAKGGVFDRKKSDNSAHNLALNRIHDFISSVIDDASEMPGYIKHFPSIEFGIIQNKEPNGFVIPSACGNKYFIGVYTGLVFRMYNILHEAFQKETNLLKYCTENIYRKIEISDGTSISESIYMPETLEQLFSQFDENYGSPEFEDEYYIDLIEDIVTYAMEFLVMHELSHVLRNHFEVYSEENDQSPLNLFDEKDALVLFCENKKNTEHKSLKQGLENDADMQAIFMGYRKMEKFTKSKPEPEHLQDILYDDIFLRGFSIGFLFMLLDNRDSLKEQFTDHPPSYLRLLYIQYYIRNYHDFESDIDNEQCTEENLNTLLELENLATLLKFNTGQWRRNEKPNRDGLYLDKINDLVYSEQFDSEGNNINSISNIIDQYTEICFIDGPFIDEE